MLQRMDEEQAARDAAVAARAAKLEAAFRRGGGDALCASLEEAARADEARAARQAAQHEAESAAAAARAKAERTKKEREQVAGLDTQVRCFPQPKRLGESVCVSCMLSFFV